MSLVLPLDNSYFFGDDKIDFTITANDFDGTITKVEILFNGTSIGILKSRRYNFSYEIEDILPGNYNLEAIATDDQRGQSSDEKVIKILLPLEEFNDTRDGNTYCYVTIENQTWMADNLSFLPEISPPLEGSKNIPYYYVYDYFGNDVSTAKKTEEYLNLGSCIIGKPHSLDVLLAGICQQKVSGWNWVII